MHKNHSVPVVLVCCSPWLFFPVIILLLRWGEKVVNGKLSSGEEAAQCKDCLVGFFAWSKGILDFWGN